MNKENPQYVTRKKGEKGGGRKLVWHIEEQEIPKGADMVEFEVVFDPLGNGSILRPDAGGLKITTRKGERHAKKG